MVRDRDLYKYIFICSSHELVNSDKEAQLMILVQFQIGSQLSWLFRGRKEQWEGWELGVGRDFTEHLPQLNRAGEVGMQGCPAPLTSWVMTSRCDRQHNCNHNLTGGVVLSFFPTYTLLGIDQEARKGDTNWAGATSGSISLNGKQCDGNTIVWNRRWVADAMTLDALLIFFFTKF